MMKTKKLAIIGASYLQDPLIKKAKERGLETHVFAWACGDVGEETADFFYPISIVEKEEILLKCREIGIDGICSIASDLASITVSYVASHMGLIGNSMESAELSTNKYRMRKAFETNQDPSPRYIRVDQEDEVDPSALTYPLIVKPLDRSGSRGITELKNPEGLKDAIRCAMEQGFEKSALIEEFVQGQEYSVEYISWEGEHRFLALTRKFTTGMPHYIETAHLEPADVGDEMLSRIQAIVSHALTSLGIRYGASHSEIKISDSGEIKIIEIGARMGGDLIGSSLVELTTGYDFVNAVIDTALGIRPQYEWKQRGYSLVRFILTGEDLEVYREIKRTSPDLLIEESVQPVTSDAVTDSSTRFGYYIIASAKKEDIMQYCPAD